MFPVLFAVGVGLQVMSSIAQGRQQAAMQREQARVAEIQGEIALEQAQFDARNALKSGEEQATFLRRQSRRNVGAMTVQTATSGSELGGSPMDVISEQIYRDEINAGNAVTNASRKAVSIESQGVASKASADASASMLRESASFAESGGWLNAVAAGIKGYAGYEYLTGGTPPTQPMSVYEYAGRANYQGNYAEYGN